MTRRRDRLARIRLLAHDLEVVLDGKLDRILDRKLAHHLALELRRALERNGDLRLRAVYDRVLWLEFAVERNVLATASFEPMAAAARMIRLELEPRPSSRLLNAAVAVLPTGYQAHYYEEFRAELADLPASRRIPYTLRLLSRSWSLRRVLQADQPPAVELPRPLPVPEYRSILVVDIAGFGRWSNPDQMAARDVLTKSMRDGFRAARVRWNDLDRQDRGDGMMVLIPAKVSKVDILDPVIPILIAGLRRHNESVATPHIKIRISLHAGEVHRDAHGWVGSDLNTACRLVDAEPVRAHLLGDAVLVVSDVLYQGVVRHRYRRVDPAAFGRVEVAEKEVRAPAWVAQVW